MPSHQLLEEVGFLVTAFGGAEPRQGFLAMGIANLRERAAGKVQCFVPGGLPEYLHDIVRIHDEFTALGRIASTDQGHREALWMPRIVEAVPTLDAEPRVIRRTVTPLDVENPIVFDVVGQLTSHATVRTQRVDRLVGL